MLFENAMHDLQLNMLGNLSASACNGRHDDKSFLCESVSVSLVKSPRFPLPGETLFREGISSLRPLFDLVVQTGSVLIKKKKKNEPIAFGYVNKIQIQRPKIHYLVLCFWLLSDLHMKV